MASKNQQLTVRRVTDSQITNLSDLLSDLSNLYVEIQSYGNLSEEIDWDEYPQIKQLKKFDLDSQALKFVLEKIRAQPFEMILFNLSTLLDNCADKSVEELAFNNKIQVGFNSTELLKEIDEYLSPNPQNYIGSGSILHQKIKDLLSNL